MSTNDLFDAAVDGSRFAKLPPDLPVESQQPGAVRGEASCGRCLDTGWQCDLHDAPLQHTLASGVECAGTGKPCEAEDCTARLMPADADEAIPPPDQTES